MRAIDLAAQLHILLERKQTQLRRNFIAIRAWKSTISMEARLASTDYHSCLHTDAIVFLSCWAWNIGGLAEAQFRSAISTDKSNAAAHAELAATPSSWRGKAHLSNARTEGKRQYAWLNVDGLLVLARLDLKQNQVPAAMAEVNRALALSQGNAPAASLKRDIAATQTGSAIDRRR